MKLSEAIVTLGLPTKYTLLQAKTAYRVKCMEHHPDRGGDINEFVKVTEAYALVTKKYSAEVCPECNGTGKVEKVSGFTTIKLSCPLCLRKRRSS